MDDDEQSKREVRDLLDAAKEAQEHVKGAQERIDAIHEESEATLNRMRADLERELKSREHNQRQEDEDRLFSHRPNNVRSTSILDFMQPALLFIAVSSLTLAILISTKPDIVGILLDNPLASALGLVAVFSVIALMLVNIMQGRSGKDSFVDIDEKLLSKTMMENEVETTLRLAELRALEAKLSLLAEKQNVEAGVGGDPLADEPEQSIRIASDSKGFEQYMAALTRSLDTHINLSESKASLLLDKGTSYLWRGIVFYVFSIIVWQVVTAMFKVGEYAVWGMVSCSLTFLVVEFLAAWFLRQYKSFTDASYNLVRVKSVFNRYLLSYFAIKEFSSLSEGVAEMRSQMLKVLEEDIKWLEQAPQKAGELNHMIAMFESVSGLVERLKTSSKANTSTTSS